MKEIIKIEFRALHYIQICLQAQGSREAKVNQMDLACP